MKLRLFSSCLALASAFSFSIAGPAASVSHSMQPSNSSEAVLIQVDGGQLTLRPLLDNAIRVQFTKGETKEKPSLILTEKVAAPDFKVTETETAITVEAAEISAIINRKDGCITFLGSDGRVLLREVPGSRKVEASSVQGEPTWSVEQSFDSPANEYLYGSGQFQDGFLNIRNLPRRLTQVNTQIAIPLVVSSRGYALLWHNYGLTDLNPTDRWIPLAAAGTDGETTSVEVTTAEGTQKETRQERGFKGSFKVETAGRYAFFLDVGQKMARKWHVEIDGEVVVDFSNLWLPPTTSWFTELTAGEHEIVVKGAKGDRPVVGLRPTQALTKFRSPVADDLDYVVIAGHGDTLPASFRELSGEVPMMPIWSFCYIHCRERYKTQDELLQNAAEFRERGIPLDVIVQDWQYWGSNGWNAMKFDKANYPDPAEMIDTLHAQHTRFMLSVWSKIDPSSDVGGQFESKGYFIPGTQWIDFFKPEARRFYWKMMSEHLLPLGIDAWWQDATEPENDDLAGRRTAAGPGETVRNVYPLFVSKTVYEGLRKDDPDRRAFILTRSAFPGQQRYASAVWSGDVGNGWSTLARQVSGGLNYVVTGMPWWTTDTGGFFRPGPGQYTDNAYRERFLRWLQFSTFSPFQRVHGYMSDTEPWRYGETFERETRRWLSLRHRMVPYIYSEAARVTREGSTLMRPLVMDFYDDPQALEQRTEYMFGPAMLAAPVLKPGVKTWPVYLPQSEGGWIDFWSGERYLGGTSVEAAAPIEQMPLFVRAGSILPLGPEMEYMGEKPSDPIELRIYPGRDADYLLYEDEGTNYGYEEGQMAIIPLHWDEAMQTLTIGSRQGAFPGMLQTRTFEVSVVAPKHAVGALRNESPERIISYSGEKTVLRLAD